MYYFLRILIIGRVLKYKIIRFGKCVMATTPDGKTKISVNIPERLVLELDEDRKLKKLDRSNWIASAVMEKLALSRKEKE